ncbi:MAG: DUF2500 family protein [Acholeplasma sp.]|jgi:uncharacterized protein YneF (UPF0154 family)|nr:MAG: DUF2500 family protein [Acholeplasma sp.]
MEFVIIAIIFIFVGLIAGIIGFLVMRKNQVNQKNSPIERASVVVLGNYAESRMVNENFQQTVDTAQAFTDKSYYVRFKTKTKKILSFQVKKKDWLKYHEGDQGILTYQGYKIIDFEPKNVGIKDINYFDRVKKEGKTGWIYGEAQALDLHISSSEPKLFDIKDLELFIKDVKNDESDWFFTIKNNKGIERQYEREGKTRIRETKLINDESMTYPMNELLKNIKVWIEGE